MNRWAANNPEEYEEISRLPPSQQNAAMRDAVGYDPDRIRDEQKEARLYRIRCEGCGAQYDPQLEACPLCAAEKR